VLDWTEVDESPHRELLAWYRDLLALRARSEDLRDDRLGSLDISYSESWLVIRRGGLRVVVNLSEGEQVVPLDGEPAYEVMAFGAASVVTEGVQLAGHSVGIYAG
jgi:maltooligosyltrehalose trehalohydrolase